MPKLSAVENVVLTGVYDLTVIGSVSLLGQAIFKINYLTGAIFAASGLLSRFLTSHGIYQATGKYPTWFSWKFFVMHSVALLAATVLTAKVTSIALPAVAAITLYFVGGSIGICVTLVGGSIGICVTKVVYHVFFNRPSSDQFIESADGAL